MVDFNSESTITRPATEVCKIVILQRRYDFLEALTGVYERKIAGSSLNMARAKALLRVLAKELTAMFNSRIKDYTLLLDSIMEAKEIAELEDSFDKLDKAIYDLGLTKIDTGKVYDSSRVENENKEKGL